MQLTDPVLLLLDLVSRGAQLRVRGDDLLIAGATPEMLAAAKGSKSALIELVRAHGGEVPGHGLPVERSEWPADAREHFEERAAIIEYDGGLPRAEAERRADAEVRAAIDEQRADATGGAQ
jgi:hypothetical protein